ncbi:MAG: immunoglobulin domain-containing protein, partial [Opitutaceae bacterium]|nr:immunoglobulin domain-containing protein [Opitutaceae bacterium]
MVTTIAGQPGSPGNADGLGSAARFRSPTAVAADGLGNVLVADRGNNRIRRIAPGGMVTTLAGDKYGRADGVGAAAQFSAPSDLVVDRSGVLFVVDDSSIRRITPLGEVSTYAGHGHSSGFEDGPVATARFTGISGIALDATGNLFLTDFNAIRKITSEGQVVTLGGSLDTSGLIDGVGGFARFNGLSGIAVDSTGSLYLADGGNSVLRKGTASLTAVAPPIITNPYGGSMKLVAGDTVTLQVMASGSEPLLYQWYRNNEPLAGATSATLTLSGVSAASEGSYVATVRNSAALATLHPTTIAVYTPALTSFAVRRSVTGGAFLWGIAAGNGRLVAVGSNGTILTSTDGRSWARQVSGTTDWLVGVTYGKDQFVAVGDQGRILVSPDGQTWIPAAHSGTTQRLNNVVYGGGTFVAVGEDGAVVTSTDAMTWVPRSSGVTTWLRGLAYHAKENYFALSGQNGVFRTSADAITWKTEPLVTLDGDLEATVAMESYATFMSVGQEGRVISALRYYFTRWTQPTLGYYTWTWSQDRAATNVRLRGVAAGANAIFVTGENGVILTAPALGGPWARLSSGTTANLVSGVFAGNTLYIVGENETIVQSDALYSSRLVNISTRGQVAAGNPMISGFVVTGPVPKKILLRAAGPALAAFGVSGVLPAPTLTLFDGAQRPIATNSGWGTQVDVPAIADAATRVGAFPFVSNSGDSAMLVTLSPGAYTAQVTTHAADGVSLIEAYDADALSNEGSRAVNISTRGFAGTGSDKLIAGFVLNGTAARRVLIRAVGPSLAPFGVANTLERPQLQLFNSRGVLQQTAGAWSTQLSAGEIRSAAVIAGAFPLQEGSADAAWLTTLSPGAWTVQVS